MPTGPETSDGGHDLLDELGYEVSTSARHFFSPQVSTMRGAGTSGALPTGFGCLAARFVCVDEGRLSSHEQHFAHEGSHKTRRRRQLACQTTPSNAPMPGLWLESPTLGT
jgi:hypothetical protein